MKLILQIPSYNEAQSLPETLRELPRCLPGFVVVETLVIDDGSTDGTAQAARAAGADHLLRLEPHAGLAAAFRAGLDEALRLGADVIVNTDADGQYFAGDLPALLAPILAGQADLVIGDRDPAHQMGAGPLKRSLQRWGSRLVSWAAGIAVADAASGFRAMTRQTALRTLVLGDYSYTLETLIQAGARGLRVVSVPVHTRPTARPSRLMRSTGEYLRHSAAAILRAFTLYRPLRVFFSAGLLFLLAGLALAARYLVFVMQGGGRGHVQSVILAAGLLGMGVQTWLIGLVADLIRCNRQMLEEILLRMRRMDLSRPSAPRPIRRAHASSSPRRWTRH